MSKLWPKRIKEAQVMIWQRMLKIMG
jgi:hypothetical protein